MLPSATRFPKQSGLLVVLHGRFGDVKDTRNRHKGKHLQPALGQAEFNEKAAEGQNNPIINNG